MMEDAENIRIDAHDTPLLNNDDVMVTETYLENEEGSALLQKSTTQVENNQSSHSTEDSHSPGVVDKVELSHCPEDYHNPIHLTHDQPDANGFKLAIDGCFLRNQHLVEPGAADVAEITGDAYIATNNNDGLHGSTDGATLDSNNHSVCTAPSDKSLEANKLVENGNEVNNVETTALESPTDSGTKEEELTNELTMEESPLDSDIKEKGRNEGVNRIELLPENETKGEGEGEGEEEEEETNEQMTGMERLTGNEVKEELLRQELDVEHEVEVKTPKKSFLLEPDDVGGDESGTDKEQVSFMKELETFHKERCLEFKPPKFYGEPLNCLKLWRAVVRLGGYEQVTSCKLWRQVGESFKPPKTCTTVSWTFRCFYEKALLEYEKYKMRIGELPFTDASFSEPAAAGNQASINQASGSGRARRDAAARAMQGWHSQRLLSNGEVGDPIIKDKNSNSLPKREKQLKSIGWTPWLLILAPLLVG